MSVAEVTVENFCSGKMAPSNEISGSYDNNVRRQEQLKPTEAQSSNGFMPNLISEKSNHDVDIVTSSILHDPSDPLDPHNWSTWKKRSVFLALMSSSILCDGGMTWGATLFVAQTFEWHISIPTSSTSMNYGILLQGFGGVFAVPFIEHFGRSEPLAKA